MLFGSLVFSLPTMGSLGSTEQFLGELAKLNQDYTTGIFFVKPADVAAGGIVHYLPSIKTAMECKEKSRGEIGDCEQNKACSPNIEFLKINQTKYRIRVIHACQNFSLVFSERFDPMWKLYITRSSDELEEKIGRIPDSANDWKTSYGAIENEKLSERQIWETWLPGEVGLECHNNANIAKSRESKILESSKWRYFAGFNGASVKWPDSFHWEANAFANGWFFDLQGVQTLPRTLNNQDGYYIQNSDGSVNFEVVIEYWPQRLLYLAYIISAVSIFICTVVVVYIKPRIQIRSATLSNGGRSGRDA